MDLRATGKRKRSTRAELSACCRRGNSTSSNGFPAEGLHKDGWKGYWSKWIQLHLARPAHREYYEMALAEARLGHADKAWEWMEKSADQREVWVTWIKVDPLLESARAHPAYKQLLRRINLAD